MSLVTADVNHQDRQEEKNGMLFYISNFLSSCFLSHLWLCVPIKTSFGLTDISFLKTVLQ